MYLEHVLAPLYPKIAWEKDKKLFISTNSLIELAINNINKPHQQVSMFLMILWLYRSNIRSTCNWWVPLHNRWGKSICLKSNTITCIWIQNPNNWRNECFECYQFWLTFRKFCQFRKFWLNWSDYGESEDIYVFCSINSDSV